MNEKVLQFFDKQPEALPLYEKFKKRVEELVPDVEIKVQKTQISFYNRHMFSCVSFARVRKKKDCPKSYIVVTFGLDHKEESSRIDIVSEPYPHRWTHHILISEISEIDEEFMNWIKADADFSGRK